MIRLEVDVILQIVVALLATLALPFYLGFVHWSVGQFLLYSGAAGLGLAAGDYLDTNPKCREGISSLGADAFLRFIAVLLFGGLIYLIAWLF